MKWNYAAWGFLALALLFTGAMMYLRQSEVLTQDRSSDGSERGASHPVRAGKLVIAYAGDLMGSLDPCG
jgi:hypothetical protein